MFDPTIFDNIKVVLEGGLYELDRQGQILINGREDIIDLAAMSRRFSMRFALPAEPSGSAELELASELIDFAVELKRLRLVDDRQPGCHLRIRYKFQGAPILASRLKEAAHQLNLWWEGQAHLVQRAESVYDYLEKDAEQMNYTYYAELTFLNKLDERQIEQIPGLLQHTAETLNRLALLIAE